MVMIVKKFLGLEILLVVVMVMIGDWLFGCCQAMSCSSGELLWSYLSLDLFNEGVVVAHYLL